MSLALDQNFFTSEFIALTCVLHSADKNDCNLTFHLCLDYRDDAPAQLQVCAADRECNILVIY